MPAAFQPLAQSSDEALRRALKDQPSPPSSCPCCCAVTIVLLLVVLVGFIGFRDYGLVPGICVTVAVLALCYPLLLAHGTYLRAQKQVPFDAEIHKEIPGAKHIKTTDGRIVEYYVFGSDQPGARVIVWLHGAGSSGRTMQEIWHHDLVGLKLRGIAPSLPGCGYSDAQPWRKIGDWPRDDLEPILSAESVGQFMCAGASAGSPHAQAVGVHFGPERCIALGLQVPQLGREVWGDGSLRETPGFSQSPGYEGLFRWSGGVYFSLVQLALPSMMSESMAKRVDPMFKKVAKDFPNWYSVMIRLGSDQCSVRGWYGTTLDLCGSHWGDFGFHPRDIQTKNIAVWYATDDTKQLPEHGAWLVDFFKTKDGINSDFRVESGYDHLTGLTPIDNNLPFVYKYSMAKCLSDLVGMS